MKFNKIFRIVNLLGKDSIQYLDHFLETEFKNSNNSGLEMIENLLKVLQNACQTLKKDFKPTLNKVFHLYYAALINTQIPTSSISDVDKNVSNIVVHSKM